MSSERLLISFVGNRDPRREDGQPGPLLSLLDAREYDTVVLLCTGPEYLDRAKRIKQETEKEIGPRRFEFVMMELESVVDYQELLLKLTETVRRVQNNHAHRNPRFEVLLDPGTPQMQTVWFILVQRDLLRATLLQGVPPHLAGGRYRVKEVDPTPLLRQPPIFREPPILFQEASSPKTTEIKEAPPPAEAAATRAFSVGVSPILGRSGSFRRALEMAETAAGYDLPVLIRGETGTGKELVARLVHDKSRRADGVFHALNCATLTASLAESVLFGHRKGAFTGAEEERLGAFRTADGGTLFLDEIGDLPEELQPRFLRVLEEHQVTPVGSDTPIAVDVRVVAATHQPLHELVENGTFRRDLLGRLTQAEIDIPPLSKRKEDIPLLLQHFLDQWNRRYGESRRFSPELLELLSEYPWPGNVRELQNSVRNMCATQKSEALTASHLPPAIRRHFEGESASPRFSWELPEAGLDLKAYLYQIEKHFYDEALKRAGGNKEAAARLLGLNGPAFRKALKERFGDA